MNLKQLLSDGFGGTTPPAITTPDDTGSPNALFFGVMDLLTIIILAIVVIALICALVSKSRELKKTKKLTELTEEQQKLLSDFDKLSDDDKKTALKIINNLNSKK